MLVDYVKAEDTFGQTSASGGADNYYISGNNAGFSAFAAPQSGTITEVRAWVNFGNGGNAKAVVYSEDGATDNQLAVSDAVALTDDAWNNFTVNFEVTESTVYNLGVVFEQANNMYEKFSDPPNNDGIALTYSSPAATADIDCAGSGYYRTLSVYAVYGEAATSEESISLVLDAPANESTVTMFAQTMNYTPILIGSDNFSNATLYVNNSPVAYNQTAIENATVNNLSYTFPENGTYLWDVQVWNSTMPVWSSNGNFTLTVGVYEPDPTATPTASPEAYDSDELFALGFAAVLIACTVTGVVVYSFKRKED